MDHVWLSTVCLIFVIHGIKYIFSFYNSWSFLSTMKRQGVLFRNKEESGRTSECNIYRKGGNTAFDQWTISGNIFWGVQYKSIAHVLAQKIFQHCLVYC